MKRDFKNFIVIVLRHFATIMGFCIDILTLVEFLMNLTLILSPTCTHTHTHIKLLFLTEIAIKNVNLPHNDRVSWENVAQMVPLLVKTHLPSLK